MLRKPNHSAAAEAHGHGHDEPHVTPMKYYWGVLGALMVLTVVTVGVSELGLPMPFSIIVAMAVALVKATLVVTVFMHLLWDRRLNLIIFLVGVFWMGIFFTLTMTDLLSRKMVNPELGNKVIMQEKADAGLTPNGWHEKSPNYGGDHGGGHGDESHGDAKKDDGAH